jgi:predicted AAA+ superfamily ATPase
MQEIIRTEYLKELSEWKDKKRIKIITGVRCSGKSTILCQFQKILETEIGIKIINLIVWLLGT